MVMFVAYNLPGNAFWKGITGSLFLGVPAEVLTLCALWYYSLTVCFHWLLSLLFSELLHLCSFPITIHITQPTGGKYHKIKVNVEHPTSNVESKYKEYSNH